eukprot:TRINITY_DN42113_c0_g1_i2.p1 TRINITY_DN42113_c0_g1~~TRINITY_DN42113_c0_g1_i2.p1  ORF type:complete len:532 (-),score=108.13 TRINITY_DN42113_c0_g1_i2:136-1731(-)
MSLAHLGPHAPPPLPFRRRGCEEPISLGLAQRGYARVVSGSVCVEKVYRRPPLVERQLSDCAPLPRPPAASDVSTQAPSTAATSSAASSRSSSSRRKPSRKRSSSSRKSADKPPRVDLACARKNADILETTNGKGGVAVWVLVKEDIEARMSRLKTGQWLSHIPGMQEACGKNSLAKALQKASCIFWPRSWRLPQDPLQDIADELSAERSIVLIVKPDAGAHGQGIALVKTSAALKKEVQRMLQPAAIVQEYIDKPLLLDGFKWDARIYALVLTVGDSFRCFLASEGLVRVCVEPYEKPKERNLHRLTSHLTNYSLSKFSDKFVFSEDPLDATRGCKRTLTAVLGKLAEDGLLSQPVEETWKLLEQLTQETVSAMWTSLPTEAVDGSWNTFHILGLDVLFDEKGKPWLMEVNNNPSLSIDCVRPLEAQSRAEVNAIFAAAKKEAQQKMQVEGAGEGKQEKLSKWGRPCRCNAHPRPHAHHMCPVDVHIKLPIVEGTLSIVQMAEACRAATGFAPAAMSRESWATGTVFRPV